MTASGVIRAIALAVFRRGDEILVAFGEDPVSGERFMRPLGGAIEFRERAADALRREIREEIGADLAAARLLGVLENVFIYGGIERHEIAFVFEASFADQGVYLHETLPIAGEDVWLGPARWVAIQTVGQGTMPLYPPGLLAMLEGR